MRSAVIAIVVALLVVGVAVSPAAARSDAKSNSWDYLLLVIRWSGAACVGVSGSCAVPYNVNDFILHGLWPNRNDNSYPSFCDNNNPFDPSQVQDLMPQLELYWTDVLDNPGDTSFWEHEWNKHGTCAETDSLLGDQHTYFQAALNLRKQADVLNLLVNNGIHPSNSTTYSFDAVSQAVSAGATSGYVYCQKDSMYNQSIFSYVSYCVDTNLDFMECPDAFVKQHANQSQCPQDIMFPLTH